MTAVLSNSVAVVVVSVKCVALACASAMAAAAPAETVGSPAASQPMDPRGRRPLGAPLGVGHETAAAEATTWLLVSSEVLLLVRIPVLP